MKNKYPSYNYVHKRFPSEKGMGFNKIFIIEIQDGILIFLVSEDKLVWKSE
jgi:hypothetical protein